jgi:hypothetical protein
MKTGIVLELLHLLCVPLQVEPPQVVHNIRAGDLGGGLQTSTRQAQAGARHPQTGQVDPATLTRTMDQPGFT